jgi:hypothetical protein
LSEREEWELVFEARNYAQAGLVRGLLESEGIFVASRGKYGLPHLGSSEPMLVMVPARDATRARELLIAYLGTPPAEAEGAGPEGPDDQPEDRK